MNETRKKISALIYNALEEKIARFNFGDNTLEEESVHDIIDNCAEEVDELLLSVDKKIDNILEELTADYLPSREEELAFFQRERERDFFRL